MGIVNVTPDSFSDGGAGIATPRAAHRALRAAARSEGADILDIGGESSRPGAAPVTAEDELARVAAGARSGGRASACPVSVDTAKPEVMRAALDLGADIVNDIHALRTPGALEVVAAHPTLRRLPDAHARRAAHRCSAEPMLRRRRRRGRGVPARAHRRALRRAGVARERIVVDPGIGFGKTPAHNLELLRAPGRAARARRPAAGRLVAQVDARSAGRRRPRRPADRRPSRRGSRPRASPPRCWRSQRGARIVRVHDVAATVGRRSRSGARRVRRR